METKHELNRTLPVPPPVIPQTFGQFLADYFQESPILTIVVILSGIAALTIFVKWVWTHS